MSRWCVLLGSIAALLGLVAAPTAAAIDAGSAHGRSACDDAIGCESNIRDLMGEGSMRPTGPYSVVGYLQRSDSAWVIRDPASPEALLRIDLPDQLLRRAFGEEVFAESVDGRDQPLIRVLGLTIVSEPGRATGVRVENFTGIQVLSGPDDAKRPLSVDGRGVTRCAKILDLLGDYCLTSVDVIAADRERYDGQRLLLFGYLRCGTVSLARDLVYASRDAATDKVSSDAVVLDGDWRPSIADAAALCDAANVRPVKVRIAATFHAADAEPERQDSIGVIRAVEAAWPLEPMPGTR